jgi:hypothetical protein
MIALDNRTCQAYWYCKAFERLGVTSAELQVQQQLHPCIAAGLHCRLCLMTLQKTQEAVLHAIRACFAQQKSKVQRAGCKSWLGF